MNLFYEFESTLNFRPGRLKYIAPNALYFDVFSYSEPLWDPFYDPEGPF